MCNESTFLSASIDADVLDILDAFDNNARYIALAS